jgi:hypothetical protein
MAKTRVRVPKTARKGEVIQIKTLISHRMETGHRQDKDTGSRIPRQIIKKFICTYNGEEVLSADWYPGRVSVSRGHALAHVAVHRPERGLCEARRSGACSV